MAKSKLIAIMLAAALIISIAANLYFVTQNPSLNSQKDATQAKIDMTATLTQAQINTNRELRQIGESLIYASKQLSTAGISGDQTDAILNALTANSSFIINSGTQNLENVMVAVEPSNWSYIEGRNVGEQTYLNTNPNGEVTPIMTPVIPLQSDMMGNALAAPIFNSNKELIGVVSVIFDPAKLLNATITAALHGTSFTTTVMQVDGLMIYDTDPLQLYKNMFTDPAYANYTQLLLLGHHVADYSSGYGTYKFTVDAASPIVVNKECYWTTVSPYGQEWRIALQHSLG
jgi:hypothetical protein